MVFATVTQVRAIVFTSTLKDEDIQEIINEVTTLVLDAAGTTDDTDKNIRVAGKNAIYAAVIRRAIETTEFAARVKKGSGEEQHDLAATIKFYEGEYKTHLDKFLNPLRTNPVSMLAYGRPGYKTVNNKL